MTVYVDELQTAPGGKVWCRLMGTDLAELDDFAVLKLGMSRDLRVSGAERMAPTFYPLRESQRKLALKKGAKEYGRR